MEGIIAENDVFNRKHFEMLKQLASHLNHPINWADEVWLGHMANRECVKISKLWQKICYGGKARAIFFITGDATLLHLSDSITALNREENRRRQIYWSLSALEQISARDVVKEAQLAKEAEIRKFSLLLGAWPIAVVLEKLQEAYSVISA